jgi:hypothetical protein
VPMEFYQGRPLEPEEVGSPIRKQIESFDTIEAISKEHPQRCRL